VSCPDASTECVAKDSVTGLVWQQSVNERPCPSTQTGECSWEGAEAYCKSLHYGGFDSGWRLPEINELLSLVHRGIASTAPAINDRVFPRTAHDAYWTNTLYAGNQSPAWVVRFHDGSHDFYGPGNLGGVRCVR
jgi:hypothetical protein